MVRSTLTGSRIRERRMLREIKQADLARSAGISPSYLNLIEHNRRPIAGKVLSDIARALDADVAVLTEGAASGLLDQLGEAAAGRPEVEAEIDRADDFVGRYPGWSGLIVAQRREIAELERRLSGLADRLAHDPFLPESLHELLSRVSAIQSTAAILEETDDLDPNWQRRFQRNLHADAQKLAEGAALLVEHLERESDPQPGGTGAQEEVEGWLTRAGWHVPPLEQALPASVDDVMRADAASLSVQGKAKLRAFLEQYRLDARRLPLAPFRDSAAELSYDPALLAARFAVDVRAIFRRLASLPDRPGVGSIGYVSADASGALTLRKRTDQLPLPRFGSACALWPLFEAMSRPVVPLRRQVAHAARPEAPFIAFSVAQPSVPQGLDGPFVMEAAMLLIPAALMEPGPTTGPSVIIGTSCRVCPATACPARRERSVLSDRFDTQSQTRNSPSKTR